MSVLPNPYQNDNIDNQNILEEKLENKKEDLMSIKVGINGFGRIGRTLFRAYKDHCRKMGILRMNPKIQIVAINEPVKDENNILDILHLLEYDSVHGRYPFRKDLSYKDGELIIDGEKIKFFSEKDPSKINWSEKEVDLVIDCTGVFKDLEGLGKHIRGTVKKVIMSAPGENLHKTIVMGVNDSEYDFDTHHIVSNASCTTNCIGPVLSIIEKELGIISGSLNTTHSYTADQNLVDKNHNDLRRSRAASMSMIPTKTGAAKAIGEVIPSLKGKMDGFAIRVPTPNVSVADLTLVVKKSTSRDEVLKLLREFSLKNPTILGVSDKELVSIDFNGDKRSSIVDSKYVQVLNDNMVKILSWYDNETGYSNRLIDLAILMMTKK